MTDALGWRRKFGVIAPSTNTIVEPAFYAMTVPGVTAHFSRIHIRNQDLSDDANFENRLVQIRGEIGSACERVLTCEPDYMVMGCPPRRSGAALDGRARWVSRIAERTGSPGRPPDVGRAGSPSGPRALTGCGSFRLHAALRLVAKARLSRGRG